MPELLLGQTYAVGNAVVDALEAAGVDMVFGMDDPQGLWCPVRRSGIRTAILHDERGGAFAADAYTRATGRLCVCTGITGPGATNLATAMLEAQQSSVPILAIVGEANPARPGLHAFQTAPHAEVLGPLAKETVKIERSDEAGAAVHRAIKIATSGRPGPVLLLVGDDLLWDEADPATPDEALNGRGVSSVEFPATAGAATSGAIAETCRLLAEARRPVIVAGGGVLIADAIEELRELAERYRVPVATSLTGKGAIADTHPLALGVGTSYTGGANGRGQLVNRYLVEADVVLVVGSDLDPLTTSAGLWPNEDASLIRVDVDPAELLMHPGLHILGDAREVLAQLGRYSASVERDAEYERWLSDLEREVAAKRDEVARFDLDRADDGYVWPGAVMQELSRHLRAGDAVVTDASFVSSWAIDRLVQKFPGRHLFGPRGSGVLGWGLPAAIGVKLARPDGRVTCVTGDGGLHYSIGELETAMRLNLPLTLIVLNNASLGFQRHSDRLHQGEDYDDLRFHPGVDYEQIAKGFAWRAARATSLGAFQEAYEQALAASEPTLIEVATDPDAHPPITKFDGLHA